MSSRGKRILLCLDGTWDNSDNGYEKPTWQNSNATLQVPSNVTRLYRALKTEGLDGKRQVMYYQPGVGTGGNLADMFAGGAFGSGISEVGEIVGAVEKDLTSDGSILGKPIVLSQQITSLVMKL